MNEMEMKARLIVDDIKNEEGTSPVAIFKRMAKKEYVSIHGPEHHILDGACLLVAFKNAGNTLSEEVGSIYQASDGTYWIAR